VGYGWAMRKAVIVAVGLLLAMTSCNRVDDQNTPTMETLKPFAEKLAAKAQALFDDPKTDAVNDSTRGSRWKISLQ
jgi:hypothetical protein